MSAIPSRNIRRVPAFADVSIVAIPAPPIGLGTVAFRLSFWKPSMLSGMPSPSVSEATATVVKLHVRAGASPFPARSVAPVVTVAV